MRADWDREEAFPVTIRGPETRRQAGLPPETEEEIADLEKRHEDRIAARKTKREEAEDFKKTSFLENSSIESKADLGSDL
jgi:hypothetical protein